MSLDALEPIARTLLYEGFLLWPYRASALKNQRRASFGGLSPQAWSTGQPFAERWRLGCDCLFEAPPDAQVEATVRFLHSVERRPAVIDTTGASHAVDRLEIDGTLHLAWDEALERRLPYGPVSLPDLCAGYDQTFAIP